MLIVSSSLPKSGSAWLYNITNDLLVAAGNPDARDIRKRFDLSGVSSESHAVACEVQKLSSGILRKLRKPCRSGYSYAVKTHAPPTLAARYLIKRKLARATYIHRDPKDCVVSLYEHAERERARQSSHPLAMLRDIDDCIDHIKRNDHLSAWLKHGDAFVLRYEDLLESTVSVIRELARHLDVRASAEDVRRIAEKYESSGRQDRRTHTHLNKGETGRYVQYMSERQIARCEELFGRRS